MCNHNQVWGVIACHQPIYCGITSGAERVPRIAIRWADLARCFIKCPQPLGAFGLEFGKNFQFPISKIHLAQVAVMWQSVPFCLYGVCGCHCAAQV